MPTTLAYLALLALAIAVRRWSLWPPLGYLALIALALFGFARLLGDLPVLLGPY